MAKKAVVLLIALVLVLGVTSAAWAQELAPPGSTQISDTLSGRISVAELPRLTLQWTEQPPTAAYVGTPFTVAARATNTGAAIPKVLYIIEIKKGNEPAKQDDVEIKGQTGNGPVESLGYDESGFFTGGAGMAFSSQEQRGQTIQQPLKQHSP